MRAKRCEICGHSFDEHDGMGDCTHLDGRYVTGFCPCNSVAARASGESGSAEEAEEPQ